MAKLLLSAMDPLSLRAELEARIEKMIALLDYIDGDCDLEPYLAGTCSDLEEDNSDYEYTLGWSNPMGLRIHVPEEAQELMVAIDGWKFTIHTGSNSG
ncbi:hypothetical protein ACQZ6F_17400 [Rhizobium sp. A22-96]